MPTTKTVVLTATVQSTTSVTGAQIGVEFLHLEGVDPIWISIDETATPPNVVAEGNDMAVVLPGSSLMIPTVADSFGIKMLSATEAKLHIALVTG